MSTCNITGIVTQQTILGTVTQQTITGTVAAVTPVYNLNGGGPSDVGVDINGGSL